MQVHDCRFLGLSSGLKGLRIPKADLLSINHHAFRKFCYLLSFALGGFFFSKFRRHGQLGSTHRCAADPVKGRTGSKITKDTFHCPPCARGRADILPKTRISH